MKRTDKGCMVGSRVAQIGSRGRAKREQLRGVCEGNRSGAKELVSSPKEACWNADGYEQGSTKEFGARS